MGRIRLLYHIIATLTTHVLSSFITFPQLFKSQVLWILGFSVPPYSSDIPSVVGLIVTESFLSCWNDIHVTFWLPISCTTHSAWSCYSVLCSEMLGVPLSYLLYCQGPVVSILRYFADEGWQQITQLSETFHPTYNKMSESFLSSLVHTRKKKNSK